MNDLNDLNDLRSKEEREEDDENTRGEFLKKLSDSQNLKELMSIAGGKDTIDRKDMFHVMTNMAGTTLENAVVNDYFALCEGAHICARAIQTRPEQWIVIYSTIIGLEEGKTYTAAQLKKAEEDVYKWRYLGSVHVEY